MKIKVKHVLGVILFLGLFLYWNVNNHSVFAKSSHRNERYSNSYHQQEYVEKKLLHGDYYKYKRDYQWGLCNSYKNITPPRYDEIKHLNDNYFAVEISSKWGVIDAYGHLVLPLEWEYITYSNEEFYLVKKNNRYGLIDIRGNIKLPIEWRQLFHLSKGNYAAKKDTYYGVIDINEKIIIPMEWDYIKSLYPDVYKVERNGLYGCYNSNGKNILEVDNSYLEKISASPFISVCNTKTGCGVLNENMKIAIPLTYDGIFENADYDNGYLAFTKDGKMGLYNMIGDQLSSVNYDRFLNIDHNVAYTVVGKLYGLTSTRENREIVPPIYTKIEKMEQKGYYKLKQDGKWGVVGYDGKFVLPCENGPFEVNRKVKKLPKLNKFDAIDDYNYQAGMHLLAYKYLMADEQKKAEIVIYKLVSSENKYEDIKIKARELAKKFNIQI